MRKLIEIFPANFISIYAAEIFEILSGYHIEVKYLIY